MNSLLVLVSAWKEEAVEPASVTSSHRRRTPTRPAPRAPEHRRTEALARLPESLTGSCASRPRSGRRAMSCTLSPPCRSKQRKTGGEVTHSLPPCKKPRARAEPAAPVRKNSSRYFKAPYVGAAENYATQSQNAWTPSRLHPRTPPTWRLRTGCVAGPAGETPSSMGLESGR